MKPRWAPGFQSQCEMVDYVLHRSGGATLMEVERAMVNASLYKLSEAQKTGYMTLSTDLIDRGTLVLGPYSFKPLGMSVSCGNMYNWDEFLWELTTLKRLGE